jgi:hypothetical protein
MKTIKFFTLVLIVAFFWSCSDEPVIIDCEESLGEVQINQYQVIGSHNSYRKTTQAEIVAFMNASAELLPPGFDPAHWDYNQETLETQLNTYGVRSFELDVYRDPEGGLFYNRLGNAFAGLDVSSGLDELLEPGLKLLHFPDFDYHTHHLTFVDALETIKVWSNTHPNHIPITILVEAKEDSPAAMLEGYGLTATFPFHDNSVEEIENEISDVFSQNPNQILKPDYVRGSSNSLREAVTNVGWPSLNETRGKIMFVLMASEHTVDDYTRNNPSLENRNMFVFTDSESPASAFIKIDDPISNHDEIATLVDQGFIVRTRADADTFEARAGDYSRMNSAFDSGAQIISTDYYRADPRAAQDDTWTDFEVRFTGSELAMIHQVVRNTDNQDCEIEE